MAKHGGKREGAVRKPKADEQALVDTLHPLEPKALAALEKGLDDGEQWAVKVYFERVYGKPKETINQTHTVSDFKIEDLVRFRD